MLLLFIDLQPVLHEIKRTEESQATPLRRLAYYFPSTRLATRLSMYSFVFFDVRINALSSTELGLGETEKQNPGIHSEMEHFSEFSFM